jgi:serine/threonine protein kinase
LVEGGVLDEKCPNVALHRGRSGGFYHPVDHTEWLRLLGEQLKRTLDDGVVRIGKQGARGVLFQVTLLVYGYTFVSKATVPEFVADLNHEAAVYRRLQPRQGVCVPVFLGAVDLRDFGRIYYYDLRVRIVYMMFLSWAGDGLDEARTLEAVGANLGRELVRSVRALHMMGVVHKDVRKENALWNRETGRVMMVDFERAALIDLPPLSLTRVVPSKRVREPDRAYFFEAVGRGSFEDERQRQLWNDVSAAKSIFIGRLSC